MSSAIDTRFDSNGVAVVPSLYAPSSRVLSGIESGVVHVTRRAEILEYDGVTPWRPTNSAEEDFARLVDGTVSVDYGTDERRKLDCQFENIDNVLRPNPYDGFWYDKIIRVFRGVEFDKNTVMSAGAIMESPNADRLKSQLGAMGLGNIDNLTTSPVAGFDPSYDYYIGETGTGASTRVAAYKRLYEQGKKIITIGIGTSRDIPGTSDGIPLYSANTGATGSWGVSPPTGDTLTSGSFVAEQTTASATGVRLSGALAGVVTLSVWPTVTPTHITAAMGFSPAGGIWLDIRVPDLSGVESKKLVASAIRYMEQYGSENKWETQLGEFLIDRIDIANFPNLVKVTGRDNTKKLMNTRLKFTSTFSAGTPLKTFLVAIAANGGISDSKMRFTVGTESLTSEMSYERGTDRWSMLKDACTAYNYEIFFGAYGDLVIRPFLDPSTSPLSWSFGTGVRGNLVTYSRSTNDSRVFNHILVYGDPSDGQLSALPYFGEAQITDPTSPVHYTRIGDRVMPAITTNFLSSDAEAQALAQERLKVAALESYELGFESVVYPWLEVGEIVDIADPLATESEPTRFLMDSLSIPLGLGSMSATGKRVTYVGSSG